MKEVAKNPLSKKEAISELVNHDDGLCWLTERQNC